MMVDKEWDYFLAYAAKDRAVAEQLRSELERRGPRVFFDRKEIEPGDEWPARIRDAQERSRATLVLVSHATRNAYYAKEELARGITLMRQSDGRHRVVPVYLGRGPRDAHDVPYGCAALDGIWLAELGTLAEVAERLCRLHWQSERVTWERYAGLFGIPGFDIAYVPLINSLEAETMFALPMSAVTVVRHGDRYQLPKELAQTPIPVLERDDPSCRLVKYDSADGEMLSVTMTETRYSDYLRCGEVLDDRMPDDPTTTFRDRFGQIATRGDAIRPFLLSNICGVGVFLRSSDGMILGSRHSEKSHVYPGRLTFSASGTMKWGAYPHPFTEMLRKCFDEARHQLDPSRMRLIGFGVDARKLFFQFSFVEHSPESADALCVRAPQGANLVRIPLDPDEIVKSLVGDCWEPAAEAALLTIARETKRDADRLRAALVRHKSTWWCRRMRDEWDYRAARGDDLADLSLRYPRAGLQRGSRSFLRAVVQFIADDCRKKKVLEVGSGTGRLTQELVGIASRVTCVELSQRMIDRSRARLGPSARKVQYRCCFAQDYPTTRHDVAVCVLVLIHNTEDEALERLVAKLAACARTVFVFEDVTIEGRVSPHTRIRSRDSIVQSFERNGMCMTNEARTKLFDDRIQMLKFVRNARGRSVRRRRTRGK